MSVGPRDLGSGQALDPAAIFDSGSPVREIITDRAVPGAQSFANRLVVGSAANRSVRALLVASSDDVAASHVLDVRALQLLAAGSVEDFLLHRAHILAQVVTAHVDTMAEWGARDGRSIADMMRSAA